MLGYLFTSLEQVTNHLNNKPEDLRYFTTPLKFYIETLSASGADSKVIDHYSKIYRQLLHTYGKTIPTLKEQAYFKCVQNQSLPRYMPATQDIYATIRDSIFATPSAENVDMETKSIYEPTIPQNRHEVLSSNATEIYHKFTLCN